MANEELTQRGYVNTGSLKGDTFGPYEVLNLGATSLRDLIKAGLASELRENCGFEFKSYSPPRSAANTKPDQVVCRRVSGDLRVVAVVENKKPGGLEGVQATTKAAEQALFSGYSIGADIAVITDGAKTLYVNVEESLQEGEISYFEELRSLSPAVIANLERGDTDVAKDPKPLAESVWQLIWMATKEEPKSCLLTFVELFVLKFLSDNLSHQVLPRSLSFYELRLPPKNFAERHGRTAIEYYISQIRPHIKQLFPDNVIAKDDELAELFGLKTIVSKTSIVNGFAFLKSSEDTVAGFNRTFLDILKCFEDFGPLTAIDPQFKLRLYETFLKKSARQQTLGQFFTPRKVVIPLIKMAMLDSLPEDSVVLDPAAGVGGFVLEPMLLVDELKSNFSVKGATANRKIKFIGCDVDKDLHILAKANMLLHLAELVRDPSITLDGINNAMADTFVLMNNNETLGALESPPRGTVDVILTNPPYVTSGSRVYKEELSEIRGQRNGLDLANYYDRCGLGVESMFLRYIAGALKPGGIAFVIVPRGMLNRTEPTPKQRILNECNLIASISLPRNTFFNTAQLTSVLVLQKRHTEHDDRPPVLCGIARSIGETLDYRRLPRPDENDLGDIASAFLQYRSGDYASAEDNPTVKIVSADRFTENDRWDVARFWTEEEYVELGIREPAVTAPAFVEEVGSRLEEITKELIAAEKELAAVRRGQTISVQLSDNSLFEVRSGDRVTTTEIEENPGDIPVYSCFKAADIVKGHASAQYLEDKGISIETKPLVTVNANGASVGKVFVRHDKCMITDDVIAVIPLAQDLDLEYIASEIRSAVTRGNFIYEAKLFMGRVLGFEIAIPIDDQGRFDLGAQRKIADAVKRFEQVRSKLADVGEYASSAKLTI